MAVGQRMRDIGYRPGSEVQHRVGGDAQAEEAGHKLGLYLVAAP